MNSVIQVSHLSKEYRLGTLSTGRLVDDVARWWARLRGQEDPLAKIGQTRHQTRNPKPDTALPSGLKSHPSSLPAAAALPSGLKSHPSSFPSTLFALKDVSFSVNQGEVLGIIGRNGAGKSTLLKILSRVTAPTSGEVRVKGRIASLLEVGTGFHPELTGRENIFLNGAILGMTKAEIRSKFDEIVAFSEVEKFIDTPVKRYSSGMYVRLAFAVAAHLEPEILIVDEVLAVGDAAFQKKCLGKMQDVAGQGRTVLFVSHNMGAMQVLATRCLLLSSGSMITLGSTADVIHSYLKEATPSRLERLAERPRMRYGLGDKVRILEVVCSGAFGDSFCHNEPLRFTIDYRADITMSDLRVGFTILDSTDASLITGFSSSDMHCQRDHLYRVQLTLSDTRLAPGTYSLAVSIGTGGMHDAKSELDVVRPSCYFDVTHVAQHDKPLFTWSQAWGRFALPPHNIHVEQFRAVS